MSVRTDVINLNVNVNGNKAQNDLNNLRKRAADVKFEMEGLKKGTAEYIAKSKELAQVNTQMVALKKEIGLASLTQKELTAELNKLKALRGSVIPFSNEYKELSKSIDQVGKRLNDVKNGVQGFSSFFSKIKDEVKQFGVVAAGYLGFQFLTSQFQNIIRGAGKMSDQLADLRRVAGLTGDEAVNLNNRFKELNTRTSTEGLREIAIIAGKLGVAKDDIFDFTAAVDKLVVSLGDELGNAEQITSQLGKILNVFNGEISADGITKLGNAFVELANTGSATGGFIADFDQRLSGIAKSAGISLGALSGLGAGLEEMGGRVESSATSIQKLVVNIASDIPAAAKIAGQSTQEFDKLFKLDPTEAILKYSEGLVKNKQSFSEVTASLKDAGEEGARYIETISKLGTGADQLRKRIDLGKQSIQESSAITEAFTLKNETFGASLDKLGKEFNKLTTSPGVTGFLKVAVEGALAFIRAIKAIPFPITIGAFTTLTGIILLYAAAKVKAFVATARHTAAELISSAVLKAKAIATEIATRAQLAAIIATDLFTGKIKLAAAAQQFYSYVLAGSLGPIGILISLVGGLAAGYLLMSNSQRKLTSEQRAANDLSKEAASIYSDQVNTVERLKKILEDENASLNLKKEAYKQLIAIHPEFAKTLSLDETGHLKGAEAINVYIKSLKDKAEVQAAETLSNKAYQEILEKQQELTEVNNKFFIQGRKHERLNLLEEIADLQKKKDYYDNIIAQKISANSSTAIGTNTGSNSGNAAAIAVKTIAVIKARLKELDDAYENIDISNKKALASNRAARKSLQDELDALEGKKSPGQKSDDSEYKRLKAEAEKFYKDIKALKNRVDAGDNPEEQEIQRATAKYEELLLKAKNYFIKSASSKKTFNEEEKIIEEAQQKELNAIFQKYFKKRFEESSAKEYEDSLTARHEFSDQLKVAAAKDYADGKISKIQYAAEIKQIDKNETADRIIIAEDYSGTVKKAASDVRQFRKKEEEQTTADLITESEARVQVAADEEAAKLRRAVLTTKPGSTANLNARKAELKYEEELEVQAAKDKYAALGTVIGEESEIIMEIRADFAQRQEEAEGNHWQNLIDKIMQYVAYFQRAINSLNQYITNRETAQFAKEKKLNDLKRKELKKQFDNKLLSQAQYDKKLNELNEEQDKREREFARKRAKREKAIALFGAIVNTAAAVAKALAGNFPVPVNIAFAALAAVLGALEIAAIASQPLPEAGRGKWFTEGDKHSDASGGIPIKIERDEAVVTAAAMTDNKEYMVRGTPAQITSALNSQAGGVNWAGGAIIKKMSHITDRPAIINPGLPVQLKQFGYGNSENGNQNQNIEGELNSMRSDFVNEIKGLRADMNTWQINLKAHVVLRDLKDKEKLYESSKNLSGLSKAS